MFTKPENVATIDRRKVSNPFGTKRKAQSVKLESATIEAGEKKTTKTNEEVKPVVSIAQDPTFDKRRQRKLLNESTDKYSKEFFVNGLADITIESLVLDTDFVKENYETIKVEMVGHLNKYIEEGVFVPGNSGNEFIMEMWNAAKEHGRYIAEEFFSAKVDTDLEKEQGALYEAFKESLVIESTDGQRLVSRIVTNTIAQEIERAEAVKSLTEEVQEEALLEEAGDGKASALKLRQLKEISTPSFYQTINNVVNEQYIAEHGDVKDLTLEQMDEIMGETIKLYTLNEALNVFKIIKFDRHKVTQATKRMAHLHK